MLILELEKNNNDNKKPLKVKWAELKSFFSSILFDILGLLYTFLADFSYTTRLLVCIPHKANGLNICNPLLRRSYVTVVL